MGSSVFDYATAMEGAVTELREFAAATTTTAGLPEELARAVRLAVVHARWGRIGLSDERLDQQMKLDWEAAHHYGGYHGYSFDLIEDWAEEIAHGWTEAANP